MRLFFFFLFCFCAHSIQAENVFSGQRIISLIDNDGSKYEIGTINFNQENEKVMYNITLDDTKFSNEFLSMRPFQCINQPKQMLCHLIYPYEKVGYITSDDLTDLEYDFLFLHKSPSEYGINAWNGLYYLLTVESDKLIGNLNEVDLNVLAAPPEDGDLRPVTKDMLYEVDPINHMYPSLVIE